MDSFIVALTHDFCSFLLCGMAEKEITLKLFVLGKFQSGRNSFIVGGKVSEYILEFPVHQRKSRCFRYLIYSNQLQSGL